MALAYLASRWAASQQRSLTALTVDHRLRPDSSREAATVARWLQRSGVRHETLVWTHQHVASGIQRAARVARYQLMTEWCSRSSVRELLLAHHLDDQAETFLMRLEAGSGVRGLGAMWPRQRMNTVTLVRPLLPIPKVRLYATLRSHGIEFIEDASNTDIRYTRNRIRMLLAEPGSGLPAPARLASATDIFRRLDRILESGAAARLRRSVDISPLGYLSIDRSAFASLPIPHAHRSLSVAVQSIGGRIYPPRTRSLERVVRMAGSETKTACTLGGTVVTLGERRILLTRELGRVAAPTPVCARTTYWDNRFRIEADHPGSFLVVGALGLSDLAKLTERPRCPDVPSTHLATLPAFRDLDGLVAVPHLNWWRHERLRIKVRATFEPRSGLPTGVEQPPESVADITRPAGYRGRA